MVFWVANIIYPVAVFVSCKFLPLSSLQMQAQVTRLEETQRNSHPKCKHVFATSNSYIFWCIRAAQATTTTKCRSESHRACWKVSDFDCIFQSNFRRIRFCRCLGKRCSTDHARYDQIWLTAYSHFVYCWHFRVCSFFSLCLFLLSLSHVT